MALPRRDWWIYSHGYTAIRSRFYSYLLLMDYYSMGLYVCLGWFGFSLRYLMRSPNSPSSMSIVSGIEFLWDPRVPPEEGELVFKQVKRIEHYHSVREDEWHGNGGGL